MKNEEIAQTYAQKVWEDRDPDAFNYVAENVTIHSLLGDYTGKEALKNVVKAWLEAFPDLKVTNQHVIAQDDRVCIHWSAVGTHKGPFKGIQPTEKQVSYAGVTLYQIKDQKITSYWAYIDMQYLVGQLK